MTTATENTIVVDSAQREFATCYLNDLLIGIDIRQVQEINRHLEITEVPHSPDYVRGVVNLRGRVVTVLDLRTILGLEPTRITDQTRNIIVQADVEHVGLLADRIADVVLANDENIELPPANVNSIDSRFFQGVHQLDNDLMVVLDVNEVVNISNNEQ